MDISQSSQIGSNLTSTGQTIHGPPSATSEHNDFATENRNDGQPDDQHFLRIRYPGNLEQPLEIVSDGEDAVDETDDDHPIDGKFAMWQATLVMLQVFSTWGVNSAFGVFLNYYLDSNSFAGATMYDFALLGGMLVCLAQSPAPLGVFLVEMFGQKKVQMVSVVVQTLGYFLASVSKEFWQLFICQGLMVGMCATMISIPGTLVLPTWFDKRKSTAMGIAVSGAGLGGVVFSLALNKVIQETGDQKWALRMTGFVTFAVSGFATAFLRPRKQKARNELRSTKDRVMANLRTVFDFSAFRSYPFSLLALWFGIVVMGYVIVVFSYANYATGIGLNRNQASTLLAVVNASQVVGRPLVGQMGDICGRYNAAGFFCAYIGILIFAFWMRATTYAELMVLAVLIGAPVGVASTMAQSLALDSLESIGQQGKIPAVWSTLNIVVGLFCLPAEVIGLKLKTTGRANNFAHAQIYAGSCYFAGFLIMLVNREWVVRQVFENRRRYALKKLENLNVKQVSPNREYYWDNEKVSREEESTLLQKEVERHGRILRKTFVSFIVRMFYPIRV